MEYVPLVEKERQAHEFFSVKQITEMVMEITKKFMERALFCPECESSKIVMMSRYLSILKTDIREFVANNRYKILAVMQGHARKREIELDTQ